MLIWKQIPLSSINLTSELKGIGLICSVEIMDYHHMYFCLPLLQGAMGDIHPSFCLYNNLLFFTYFISSPLSMGL